MWCMRIKWANLKHNFVYASSENGDWGYTKQIAEGNIWTYEVIRWREAGEDVIIRSFITCTLHQMLLG